MKSNSNNWVYYIIGFIIALSILTVVKANNEVKVKEKPHTIQIDIEHTPIDYIAKHK